jgi:hypothetical protein
LAETDKEPISKHKKCNVSIQKERGVMLREWLLIFVLSFNFLPTFTQKQGAKSFDVFDNGVEKKSIDGLADKAIDFFVDNCPEALYSPLVGDAWKKVVIMGQMIGWGAEGLVGHNDCYYVIEGNLGLKVTWGDFSSNQANYPMLLDPRKECGKIVKIYDPVYVLHEGFDAGNYNHKKMLQRLETVDLTSFCKKYGYNFDKDQLDPYDAQFIIDKSWAKVENGIVYKREYKSDKFVEYKNKKP